MNLKDKVAVVTGAAQGIGSGIARVFAEEGARVIVVDIQEDQGHAEVENIVSQGGMAEFIQADVSQEADVTAVFDRAVRQHGTVHMVVNNAAICLVKTVEESTVEEWDRVMAVNVRSIFLTTKYAVPQMRKQGGGSIVNVASVGSFIGQQQTPAYIASKGAVLLLTRTLAVDYGPDNIRVNCICPGITDTPMLRYHLNQSPDPEQNLKDRLRRVPTGQILQPEGMGRATAFLCGEHAQGITGASLVVDGGYISCAEFSP